MATKKLVLIDGSHLAYRSYFALIRNPLINSKGENTSAVYAFVRSLYKILDEIKPDYVAVIFDSSEPTFRHKQFEAYKATREKMPDGLSEQLPRIRSFIEAMRIPILEIPGYEADDVMATLAQKAAEQQIETYLVTGDKDFFQLLSPLIKVYRLRRSGEEAEIVDPQWLQQNWKINPQQVPDFLGLTGDSIDNIPGVPGIGEKTAKELIQKFGTLEAAIACANEVSSAKIRNALNQYKEQAELSKRLVTLDSNVPVVIELESLRRQQENSEALLALFKDLEFNSLIARYVQSSGAKECLRQNYHTILTKGELLKLIEELKTHGSFVIDTETSGVDPLRAEIVGFSFAYQEGVAFYVPVCHNEKDENSSEKLGPLFAKSQKSVPTQGLPVKQVINLLKPIMENEKLHKCGQNIKYDMVVLSRYGVELLGVDFDTMVASYLLNPSDRRHNLDRLTLEYLNHKKVTTEELIGKGKKQISIQEVPLEQISFYACEDADMTLRLRHVLETKLQEFELYDLFKQVEIPLISVLMEMERNGVAIDVPLLQNLSRQLGEQLQRLEEEIFKFSGERFNINSPQQLGKILFERLKLPRARRTKTGYSTDVNVLEELAKIHPLPRYLLEYRQLMKLKSTYVDTLPKLINPHTGRLHTSYNQTVTATGRLSSSDPNLQNIPIRTDWGREIRRAFTVGSPDHLILDADYSQIELRIMAHLSRDARLRKTFQKGEDVHTITAAEVFGVKPEEVTPELRRRAKEINFGIMYGMGPFGLASRLEISVEEAEEFIRNYFIKYPDVNDFIIRTIAEAKEKGYVTTLLNRRRYLPEINSENRRMREFAERTAINTPIQGTAADLIKVAMIRIWRQFKNRRLSAKMIMQVHDELVFEVPKAEVEEVKQVVRQEMENAIQLQVPVKVDIGVGANWLEAHA